jgi:23S rRNA pseudouridine1911/1915/1917 synthase
LAHEDLLDAPEMTEEEGLREGRVRRRVWNVADEHAGGRLDVFVAEQVPEVSRSRLQALINSGRALVNGRPAKRSYRMAGGDTISLQLPEEDSGGILPEDIPIEVLYEDSDLAVVNKPAGIVVHPGAGVRGGTLAGALLGRFGSLSTAGGTLRPGIVHRLDKETSGALLVARNDETHRRLVAAFSKREVRKRYVALVHGKMEQKNGRIELPVSRDTRRKTRMTTRLREGRAARTDWRVLALVGTFTLIEALLHTGRTHQIRVHMSSIGHPVVGDTVYGAPREVRIAGRLLSALERNFLHAACIGFAHPASGETIEVRAPLPAELVEYINLVGKASGEPPAAIDAALLPYL